MTKAPTFTYYTTSELIRAATAPKITTRSRILMQEEIARREAAEANTTANPIAYLRDAQPDAEDEALVVCWKGDPGAFPVFAK